MKGLTAKKVHRLPYSLGTSLGLDQGNKPKIDESVFQSNDQSDSAKSSNPVQSIFDFGRKALRFYDKSTKGGRKPFNLATGLRKSLKPSPRGAAFSFAINTALEGAETDLGRATSLQPAGTVTVDKYQQMLDDREWELKNYKKPGLLEGAKFLWDGNYPQSFNERQKATEVPKDNDYKQQPQTQWPGQG